MTCPEPRTSRRREVSNTRRILILVAQVLALVLILAAFAALVWLTAVVA